MLLVNNDNTAKSLIITGYKNIALCVNKPYSVNASNNAIDDGVVMIIQLLERI